MISESHKRVGIIFGGRSVEHEVSVITGIQAAHALSETAFHVVPIYVAKDGDWYTGDRLLDLSLFKDLKAAISAGSRVVPCSNSAGGVDLLSTDRSLFGKHVVETVDVILLAMHGAEGENGALQGTLEVLNVAYSGSDVRASAIGMDKSLSKVFARAARVPVLDDLTIADSAWIKHEDSWLARCSERIGFPMIVKPMRLGSSIGIGRADDREQLEAALEDVFRLDSKALVEPCIVNLREFNCSVLAGSLGTQTSVIEEPVRTTGSALLSFEQKYQRGGTKGGRKTRLASENAGMASLERIIPANVPGQRENLVQEMARKVFDAIGCGGVARIDFLYDADQDTFYFNEINTVPGSFSFYLWEPSGLSFDRLLEELIIDALRTHRSRNAKIRSYETNLLAANALSGLKS